MSAVAVAAFYDALLELGARRVAALVWVRPAGFGDGHDATLRIWAPLSASVEVLREVTPASTDLRDGAISLDEHRVDYPAGRWTDAVREYELVIALPAGEDGDELRAARVTVLVEGEVAGQAAITVTWSADAGRATTSASNRAAIADLPTGPSPQARHTQAPPGHAGEPCPGCGVLTSEEDRFCEGCGRALDTG